MAGFWVVMLPFLFAGIAVVTAFLIALGAFLTVCGVTMLIIGILERRRQAKHGIRNPVHIFMIVYGILMLLTVSAGIFIVVTQGTSVFQGLFLTAIYSLLGIPTILVLIGVFLLLGGISLVVIGYKERKRQLKWGKKNPVHIIIMIYGVIMAATPIATVIGWSAFIGILTFIAEHAEDASAVITLPLSAMRII